MNDAQKALKDLYDLLNDGGFLDQIEAQFYALDADKAETYERTHWLGFLAVVDGVRVALGIDRDEMPTAKAVQP